MFIKKCLFLIALFLGTPLLAMESGINTEEVYTCTGDSCELVEKNPCGISKGPNGEFIFTIDTDSDTEENSLSENPLLQGKGERK
jgi:hypothetical protein